MQLLRDNPLLVLFIIVALGLLLGAIKIRNLSLGMSGVIFSALGFGMLACTIPASVDKVGLVLFTYAVGLGAGHGFFAIFKSHGARFAKLGVIITGSGAAVAWGAATVLKLPAEVATGIFAGALTSTPGLASALDVASDQGAVSVGYGLAYPIGVISVVLFVQLFPRIARIDLAKAADNHPKTTAQISRVLAEVQNPLLFGRRITDVRFFSGNRCRILRYLDGEQLVPVTPETCLEQGMHVLVVGEEETVPDAIDFLGKKSTHRYVIDSDTHHTVVVTSPNVVGKTLRELGILSEFGLTISRISRHGVEFIPSANTVIQPVDILTVVGPRENTQRFKQYAGHKRRVLNETDLVAVVVGIGTGIFLGMMPITIPGVGSFTLGLAGGPLVTGLVMAHFGQIGRFRGYIPPAARLMMMNLGLVFFLAGAGITAGARIGGIIAAHGPALIAMAALVAVVPMLFGYLFARKVLKLDALEALGGITGGMTSTPGLGAVNSAVDSEVPAMSYAAIYPVALIFMTVLCQLLVRLLG